MTPVAPNPPDLNQRAARTLPGLFCLLIHLGSVAALLGLMAAGRHSPGPAFVFLAGMLALAGLASAGYFTCEPNQARVLTLFGAYRGTVRETGLRWANPFYQKKLVSLRVRNFETQHLKVNDHEGNPIEIAAVVVWQVVDTAYAVFRVENYEHFVHVQSEAALRNLATRYPYDAHDHAETVSLRSHTAEVAGELQKEIQSRLALAGVRVVEARISHLAYAQEIAQAMLQRQQATAIVAARHMIVEGAVGMVELALERLSNRGIVQLDEERKAAMVSNLLVVLCSERSASPVVNTGTLYP